MYHGIYFWQNVGPLFVFVLEESLSFRNVCVCVCVGRVDLSGQNSCGLDPGFHVLVPDVLEAHDVVDMCGWHNNIGSPALPRHLSSQNPRTLCQLSSGFLRRVSGYGRLSFLSLSGLFRIVFCPTTLTSHPVQPPSSLACSCLSGVSASSLDPGPVLVCPAALTCFIFFPLLVTPDVAFPHLSVGFPLVTWWCFSGYLLECWLPCLSLLCSSRLKSTLVLSAFLLATSLWVPCMHMRFSSTNKHLFSVFPHCGHLSPAFRASFIAITILSFPGGWAGKESTCSVADLGLIPELGISPREENGYSLQYSGLENSMDCIVHRLAKSQTWLSNFHFHFQ